MSRTEEKKTRRDIDMTQGPIAGPMLLFILPLIGGSLFQLLYNTVDFLFVGNFLDKTAAAAVGASSTLISCTVGMFSGISVGTSVVAAQAIGAGHDERASRAVHTAVAFGLIGGALMLIMGEVFAPHILRLLNTPETVLPQAVVYIRIYLISLPMLIFYNMVSGGMRSYGDSRSPFLVLVVCGLLNVVFDAVFILVIPLGVAGVAIATTLTQSLSALLVGYLSSRPGARIRLQAGQVSIDRELLKNILHIGLPTGIQTIIITFSNVIVQYYINSFGETAVAAFATYYKVENLNYMPIMAFGQAATTFAGQNTGAGKFRRVKKGTVITALMGMGIVLLISRAILLFPETVFGWFMKDTGVVGDAVLLASVSFPFYFIYPVLEVFGGSVRGMGYSLLSMIVVILNMCVLRISLLAIFTRTVGTLGSLAAVYPITWATASVSFLIIFFIIIRRKIAGEKAQGAKT